MLAAMLTSSKQGVKDLNKVIKKTKGKAEKARKPIEEDAQGKEAANKKAAENHAKMQWKV